jgi:peroxiredoxin
MRSKHAIFFFLIAFLVFVSCSKKEATSEAEKPVALVNQLPQMTLEFSNDSKLSARDLTGRVILIFFQPDCDHCQREAEEIKKNLDAFGQYTLYFVSAATAAEMDAFAKTYGLDSRENIRFAKTEVQMILDNYGAIKAPSMYIYNNGKLTQSFNGETDIQVILKSI